MINNQVYEKPLAKELLKELGNPTPKPEHLELAEKLLLRATLKRQLTFDKELTAEEVQVLFWAAQGYSIEKTAKKMNIKFSSAQSHRKEIRRKLKCSSIAQAVYEGICFGYISPKLVEQKNEPFLGVLDSQEK